MHFVLFIVHSAWPFLGYTKCYYGDVILNGQTVPWAFLFLWLPVEECSVWWHYCFVILCSSNANCPFNTAWSFKTLADKKILRWCYVGGGSCKKSYFLFSWLIFSNLFLSITFFYFCFVLGLPHFFCPFPLLFFILQFVFPSIFSVEVMELMW